MLLLFRSYASAAYSARQVMMRRKALVPSQGKFADSSEVIWCYTGD